MRTPALALLLAAASGAFAADMTVARLYDSQLSTIESELMPLVKETPEAAFGFVPKAGAFSASRSFGAQAKHIASVLYMVSGAALKEKVPVDLGKDEDGPDTVKSKAEIVQYLSGAFAYAHKAMLAMTPAAQLEMVKAPWTGPDMARGALAALATSHTFDHYGQMCIYARLNNIIPPASRQ
jgi:hypothetical protein